MLVHGFCTAGVSLSLHRFREVIGVAGTVRVIHQGPFELALSCDVVPLLVVHPPGLIHHPASGLTATAEGGDEQAPQETSSQQPQAIATPPQRELSGTVVQNGFCGVQPGRHDSVPFRGVIDGNVVHRTGTAKLEMLNRSPGRRVGNYRHPKMWTSRVQVFEAIRRRALFERQKLRIQVEKMRELRSVPTFREYPQDKGMPAGPSFHTVANVDGRTAFRYRVRNGSG